MIEKKEEEEREEEKKAIEQIEENAQLETKESEIREGQKEFENRSSSRPLTIKFRLASKVVAYTFDLEDKVETVFRYVNCCLRDGFESRYSEFKLTQAFPSLNMKDYESKTLL